MSAAFSARTAKAVRILSVPPVMAALFILILYAARPQIIATPEMLRMALSCLSFVPLLAYPLSWVFSLGRERQRLLAMVLSAAAYLVVYVWSLVSPCPPDYRFICGTYVFSVVLLLTFNKLLKVRSSGHACSVTGPIVLLCYFLGPRLIPVCTLLYALVFWASLRAKRHTAGEYLWGSFCCIAAGVISYLVLFV